MQRRQLLTVAALAAAGAWQDASAREAAHAVPPQLPLPPELAIELPDARWRGAGVLRFLGRRIYDARLWSAAAVTGDGASQPLALELVYARRLVGTQIARRSIQEMNRLAPLTDEQASRWLAALTGLFPDVEDGDRLTGIQRPGRLARFYLNGHLRGDVADADFVRLFFGIWLSPRTSEPRLREALLGGGA
jgi:hypothetical protein